MGAGYLFLGRGGELWGRLSIFYQFNSSPIMPTVPLQSIVDHCSALLCPDQFTDYDLAHNGLQVANRDGVQHIVAAVDASLATIRRAATAGASLMVVHHGLFWGNSIPWTGRRHELICALVEADLAIYSMHLPLDAHPTLGNAALLAGHLRLKRLRPFFQHQGRPIGWQSTVAIPRSELANRLSSLLGRPPILLPGGPELCRKIGICTGGAGAELKQAASEGVDTFITGEGPHWTHSLAEDAGINVFYGGHYATETFGVKALAESLAKQFSLTWEFIDHPSGL